MDSSFSHNYNNSLQKVTSQTNSWIGSRYLSFSFLPRIIIKKPPQRQRPPYSFIKTREDPLPITHTNTDLGHQRQRRMRFVYTCSLIMSVSPSLFLSRNKATWNTIGRRAPARIISRRYLIIEFQIKKALRLLRALRWPFNKTFNMNGRRGRFSFLSRSRGEVEGCQRVLKDSDGVQFRRGCGWFLLLF